MNYSRLNKLAALLKSSGFHKEANQIKSFAHSIPHQGGPDEHHMLEEKMNKVVLSLKELFKSLPEVKGRETQVCEAVANAAGITDEESVQDVCFKVMNDTNEKRREELDRTQRGEIDRPFDSDAINAMLASESERDRDAAMVKEYEEKFFGRHSGHPKD
jgi:hypothetical protein